MNPPIIVKKVTPKEISEIDGGSFTTAFAEYKPEINQHIITIPHRASTKTRLHEIAHCELGHCIFLLNSRKISIDKYVEQEIDADEWAFSRCCKTISFNAVLNLAHSLIVDFKRNPGYILNACIKALAKHNYHLDKKLRSELWWQCRDFEKERKTNENTY